MGIEDSIAQMSMAMSTANLQMNTSIAVAKEAMNTQEMAAAQLLDMLPAPGTPGLGENVDILA